MPLGDDVLGDADAFAKLLGDSADTPSLRRDLAAMTTRAYRAEQKIADVVALCNDPGESHRMLSRLEILRLLR